MAFGDPYAPAYGQVATPITLAPTDISGVGVGGVSNTPSQLNPWQFPLLGSTVGGGLNYPTFGEQAGLGVAAAPPAPAAAAPAATVAPPALVLPPGTGSPHSPGAGNLPQGQTGMGATIGSGAGPSQGGTVTPSTANDPTGGMAASGDTQASANGGSSAGNAQDGSGMSGTLGKAAMAAAGLIPTIGPVIGLANTINGLVNPAPTPAQISAQAAVNQAMADQSSQNTPAAPSASDNSAADQGAGVSSGQGSAAGDSGQGDAGAGGPAGGAGTASAGGGVAAGEGSTGGPGGIGSVGPGGGGVGTGGDGGDGGSSGGSGDGGDGGAHAGGGFVQPGSLVGHSPAPDTGYISARPNEYVVNAKATAKYLPILEAINKGTYDPANPPGVSTGDGSMAANGGAPFGMAPQANPGFGDPGPPDQGQGNTDPTGGDGDADDQAGMLAGPQDPANTSPLMPFPSSMALSPDAAMQRLAALPTDQRAALAQVVADPTIQGALMMVLGPPFAQFIQAAQSFMPSGGAPGAAPAPGGQPMPPAQMPSASSGAPGGAVSPGPGGPMPGPSNIPNVAPPPGPPQMPHAAGGMVHAQDVRYTPPPYQHSAPPGIPQQMPVTGLRKVGMNGGRPNLSQGGYHEMPMAHRAGAGQG
jgi:hypothetical protein